MNTCAKHIKETSEHMCKAQETPGYVLKHKKHMDACVNYKKHLNTCVKQRQETSEYMCKAQETPGPVFIKLAETKFCLKSQVLVSNLRLFLVSNLLLFTK